MFNSPLFCSVGGRVIEMCTDRLMQPRLESCDLMKGLYVIGAHKSADASVD